MSLKTTSGEFLGMYVLDFSCSSILHQLWAHMTYFKGKKVRLIFHPFFTLFSPPGRLPKAITTPWKCLLRVPWWNTFQWGPRKTPKPLLTKKNFEPWNPKSQSQPSVQWKEANVNEFPMISSQGKSFWFSEDFHKAACMRTWKTV